MASSSRHAGEISCNGSNWTTRRVIGAQTVARVHPTPIAGSDIPAAQTKFNDQLKQQPYRGNSDSAKRGRANVSVKRVLAAMAMLAAALPATAAITIDFEGLADSAPVGTIQGIEFSSL